MIIKFYSNLLSGKLKFSFICVCVGSRERDREGEREKEKKRERERACVTDHFWVSCVGGMERDIFCYEHDVVIDRQMSKNTKRHES